MNPGRSIHRHPFLWLTGLLLAAVALWIGYFLATFDLDHYRELLADELGNRLQMPVRLGEVHLELREAGIALRFNKLRIGTEQTPLELHVEEVRLQLAWHGLLLKKPLFTEVALNSPRLRIAPAPAAAPDDSPSEQRSRSDTLRDLQIHNVEIQNGALEFHWLDRSGEARSFALGDLTMELADLGLDRRVTFKGVGSLLQDFEQARLAIDGSVDLPATGNLREAVWDLAVEAKNLEAARLASLLPDRTGISAAGQVDLDLHFKGALNDSVTAQAELTGNPLLIRPATAYGKSLALTHLQLAGTWQQQDGTHLLRQLAVQLDDLRLSGEIAVKSTATDHAIRGKFGNCTLPADTLRRWLPDELLATEPLLARMQPGGMLSLRQGSFRAVLPGAAGGRGSVVLERAEGEVNNLVWSLGEGQAAELAALKFRLEDGRWQLDQGAAKIAGVPVTFAGSVTPQDGAPAQVDIELAGSSTAEQVVALLPKSLPPALALAGALTLQGQLTGTVQQLTVDARLDLAQLDVRYGQQLHLPPTPGAALTLHGQTTLTALTIDQAALAVPPLNGSLSGIIDWTGATTVELAARLELPELAAARELVPTLGKLQLQGAVILDLTLSGPVESARPRMRIELREVGIPLHGVVADISRLNGHLLLEGKGVRSEKLTAHLGKSPVALQARVADLTAPRLELGVSAAAIRADELIFRSGEAMLRDLSGELLIDRDGIAFVPVRVKLDGGTQATIRGSVKNFNAPTVELAIAGEYANVKEIIGLWTDEAPTAKSLRVSHHADADAPGKPLPSIRIEVDAKSGDLYGMKFTNASALIVPTREQLLIHPLNFNIGEGYCSTQVIVDHAGAATVLRVSGHVEKVDTYAIYNELLAGKSIMRGTLRSDFYVQGELGKPGFLPTSYGSFNVAVRDGVMRHSPILGTIFSLLNVSQLFAMKLPDVNLEGVPFSLLTAELQLDKGVLRSENLVIVSNAMNMSYAGQFDMVQNRLDLLVVVKPLGTVDKVVSNLPIVGWILGGKERALITAQFEVTGPAGDPKVEAIPISAMSKGVLGVFKRILRLPLKLIDDPAILWGGGGKKQ